MGSLAPIVDVTMGVWSCTDHDGLWPVGVASVIVAANEEQARGLLRDALRQRKLNPDAPFTLKSIRLDEPAAIILNDGNY